jgi:hypothetical protein
MKRPNAGGNVIIRDGTVSVGANKKMRTLLYRVHFAKKLLIKGAICAIFIRLN